MSTINVTNLKHASSGSNNIVLDSSGNATASGNLTVSGNATVSGTLANTGNLTITSGNLVLSSGNGIDFSATANSSGTMTSELLDDYEEGTWTPTYYGDGGGSGQLYTTRVGYYTKIGRTVVASAEIQLSDKGTITGYPIVSGLPFSKLSSDAARVAFVINFQNMTTSVYAVGGFHGDGSQFYLTKVTGTSTATSLFASGGGDVANNTRFMFTYTYQTN